MSTSHERLFLGVALSEDVRAALAHRIGAALPGGMPVRMIPPANWHLTLRFLGDTGPAAAEAVRLEMSAAPLGEPFAIELGALGAFPAARRARVVWIGVSRGAERLTELAGAVESAARRAGFPAERRPFAPHLTLGRLREPRDLRPVLEQSRAAAVQVQVAEVTLFRSALGAGGALYEVLRRYPLRPSTQSGELPMGGPVG